RARITGGHLVRDADTAVLRVNRLPVAIVIGRRRAVLLRRREHLPGARRRAPSPDMVAEAHPELADAHPGRPRRSVVAGRDRIGLAHAAFASLVGLPVAVLVPGGEAALRLGEHLALAAADGLEVGVAVLDTLLALPDARGAGRTGVTGHLLLGRVLDEPA